MRNRHKLFPKKPILGKPSKKKVEACRTQKMVSNIGTCSKPQQIGLQRFLRPSGAPKHCIQIQVVRRFILKRRDPDGPSRGDLSVGLDTRWCPLGRLTMVFSVYSVYSVYIYDMYLYVYMYVYIYISTYQSLYVYLDLMGLKN
jgi:hypothetical protein